MIWERPIPRHTRRMVNGEIRIGMIALREHGLDTTRVDRYFRRLERSP